MKTVLTLLALMLSINAGSGITPLKPLMIDVPVKDVQKDDYTLFTEAMGRRESNNWYGCDTNMPYWGYYQIGPAVRTTLKVKVTWKQFKADSLYQDYVMYQNLKYNEQRIRQSYFDYFIGKEIKGVKITYSGILAGAHLAGGHGVRRFLATNGRYDPSDVFGTKLSDYIEEFGGYQFDLNEVKVEYTNGNNSSKTNIQVQRVGLDRPGREQISESSTRAFRKYISSIKYR